MSSSGLPAPKPHPVRSLEEAERNRVAICDPRGFCGPFVNEEYYAAFEDDLWRGMAECAHCCSTVHMATELLKWEASIYLHEFGVRLAPAEAGRSG